MWHSFTAFTKNIAWLCTSRNTHSIDFPIWHIKVYFASQCGIHHRNRNIAVEGIPITGEDGVWFLPNFHVKIASGATTWANIALGDKTNTHTATHSGRNFNRYLAVTPYTSFTSARMARVGNNLSGTTAVWARMGCDNLAEEGLLYFLNLPCTATIWAGGWLCSRGRPGTLTIRA